MPFFLLCYTSLAQTVFSGKIVDENNEPIPFAHIRIEKTNLGTISNEKGLFKLIRDKQIENNEIVISTIGYKTKKLQLKKGHHIINLIPEIIQLKEVTLTPINYGRELVGKALKAIPKNYPKTEERHTGFIRETTNWKSEKQPIYIVEAVIESVKKPYLKRQLSGDVKLDEFRKYISGQLDSLNTRIYAGSHHIHRFDVVARREAFLGNPNAFEYEIKDTLQLENNDVYKVYFEKKNELSGHVFILDSTFAIVKIEIENATFNSLFNINGRLYLNYITTYEQGNDGLWRFKHSHYETAFDNKGKILELTSDYVTTEVEPNVFDIPYVERFQFSDFLIDAPKPYIPNFWSDYNIILPDAEIENLFQSANIVDVNLNEISRSSFFNFLHRLKSNIALTWEPIKIAPFTISYENQSFDIQESNISNRKGSWNIASSLSYEITSNLFVGYAFNGNITKTGVISHDFVVSKSMNLNPSGRPILLSPRLKLGYQQVNSFYKTYESTEDFSVIGKTFDSNNINVFLSQRNFRVQPNIAFEIEKDRKIHFLISAGYNFQFNGTTGLLFHEKNGFFLFRKKAFLKNGNDGLLIESTNKNLLENKVSVGAGVVYKF